MELFNLISNLFGSLCGVYVFFKIFRLLSPIAKDEIKGFSKNIKRRR